MKLTEKRWLVSALCFASMFAVPYALQGQDDPPCDSVEFIVALGEMTTDLSPRGLTTGDSLIVMPDGRFHLQRRLQQLPSKTATLKIFESSLSRDQLRALENILDELKKRDLPKYVLPTFPLDSPWFGMFEARIGGAQNQKVGFWVDAKEGTVPEETRNVWRDSELALRPLLRWFHEVEAMKLEPNANAKPLHLCVAESTQN